MFKKTMMLYFLLLSLTGCKEVTVDFASEENPSSMSGFLGVISENKIKDEYVTPLAPKYWRGPSGLHAVEQAEKFDAKLIYVVGNGWAGPMDKDSIPPFEDYEKWKSHVREATSLYGTRVIYDLWNEPDIPLFWGFWEGATLEKFLETAKVTHDVIREELGEDAIISGPSISLFSRGTLKKFMDFCKDNEMKVQIMSFHLLYQPDSFLPLLEVSMKKLKQLYIGTPEYASVGLEEIHVNEFLMAYQQNSRPGSILAFMRTMESAGMDGAAKACWSHPKDCSNIVDCYLPFNDKWKTCGDGSINGLLTPDYQPRAAWWAYKHYADGVESRVEASSKSSRIRVLASRESMDDNIAQVMLAYNGDLLKNLKQIDVELTNLDALSFIQDEPRSIEVTVKRIPYIGLGSREILELPVESIERIPVQDGKADLVVSDVNPYDAFVILIAE